MVSPPLVTQTDILNAFNSHDLSSIEKCRKLAEEVFGKRWQELEDKVYQQGEDSKVDSWGIGNCHIDTAWLVSYILLTVSIFVFLRICSKLTLGYSAITSVDLCTNSSKDGSVSRSQHFPASLGNLLES